MNTIYTSVWILWLSSEILMNLLFRANKRKAGKTDKNSLAIIWFVIALSISAAVYLAYHIHMPISGKFRADLLGIILIPVGMVIRFSSIASLGRFFTVNLSVHERHTLLRTGMFRYIRHPSYTGSLLSFVGLGLSINNVASFFMIVVPVTAAFLYRISIEEKMLSRAFGAEYKDYKTKTKRLIPFVY